MGKKNAKTVQIRGKTDRSAYQRCLRLDLRRVRTRLFFRGVSRVFHSCLLNFLRNVHILFTCALFPSSPAGLRLEITFKIDKKKMNFIFIAAKNFFLTKKPERACPRKIKMIIIDRKSTCLNSSHV